MPTLPQIQLYTSHPSSGLGRLSDDAHHPAAPYWAYPWAGGLALAHHVLDNPKVVEGRRVLDLGAGSGLVAIAAARAGAASVLAAESDINGRAALALNAGANGVAVTVVEADVTGGAPPAVDLVLAGDVFYDAKVARLMARYLDACLAAGLEVLVGDPERTHLPRERLQLIAEYRVPDFGMGKGGTGFGGVFRWKGK